MGTGTGRGLGLRLSAPALCLVGLPATRLPSSVDCIARREARDGGPRGMVARTGARVGDGLRLAPGLWLGGLHLRSETYELSGSCSSSSLVAYPTGDELRDRDLIGRRAGACTYGDGALADWNLDPGRVTIPRVGGGTALLGEGERLEDRDLRGENERTGVTTAPHLGGDTLSLLGSRYDGDGVRRLSGD